MLTDEINGEVIDAAAFFKAHGTLLRFPVDKFIKQVAFYQWPGSTSISCLITCHNGFEEQDFSRPRVNTHFDLKTGIEAAFMRTRDKLWALLAYLEREDVK